MDAIVAVYAAWGIGAKGTQPLVIPADRRRFRELYRLHRGELLPGYDIIMVARVRAAAMPYQKLESQYLRCLAELGLLGEDV